MDDDKIKESMIKEGMSRLRIKEGLHPLRINTPLIKKKILPPLRKPEVKIPPAHIMPPVPGQITAPSHVPKAPALNPFDELPFPNPGERIKASDFKALSQSLSIVRDVFSLSSSLFGRNFGMVKTALVSQQYDIQRVMTVFGAEIDNLEDDSLDNRKVVQIMPAELGEGSIIVVLAEAVETRRFTPNVLGMSYAKASEKLRSILGDVTFPSSEFEMPRVTDFRLEEAKEEIFE